MLLSRTSLLLFTAIVSLGVGGAFTKVAQDEAKAETVYKNIQVFKGAPASQIDPTMHAITASLGVRCTYCHVRSDDGKWDFPSDAKEEKKTAREMILMMKKINDENFNGKMEVTCATCHQGRSHPASAVPIGQPRAEAARPAGAPPALPAAEEVVAKYEQALGGASALKGVASLHLKGTLSQGRGDMQVEVFAKGASVLSVVTTPQGVFKQGFDGTNAWSAFGPRVEKLAGDEASDAKTSSPFAYLNLRSQFSSFGRVRKDTLDGKDVLVVNGMQVGVPFTRLYFDAGTGFLLRKSSSVQTLVGMMPSTEDYSDYAEVGGIKVAHKLVQTTSEGIGTMVFTSVQANESIPDSTFAMPAG